MNHPLTVLPVKKPVSKEEFNIPLPLLAPPFTYVFVAPTKSGKSVLTVNLLKNINFGYRGVFEEIYYISPTVMLDDTLNKAVAEDDDIIKIHDEEDLEKIDDILSVIVKDQKDTPNDERKQKLIVLDDMLDYFNNYGKLNSLPALSRHYKLSFIVCSQVYVGLPVKLRKNASAYMVFQIYNNKDLDTLDKEVGVNFGKDFLANYHEATNKKYDFLFINNREMNLYHNFTTMMWEK
jgi:hypothetical protein